MCSRCESAQITSMLKKYRQCVPDSTVQDLSCYTWRPFDWGRNTELKCHNHQQKLAFVSDLLDTSRPMEESTLYNISLSLSLPLPTYLHSQSTKNKLDHTRFAGSSIL